MQAFLLRFTRAAAMVAATALTTSLWTAASAEDAEKIPAVSARSYVGGAVTVVVTGSFQMKATIPINQQASFSDGEMTWLQFGASGSDAPNLLLTVSPHEIGFGVGQGKQTATAGAESCTGGIDVKASLITGHYTCRGVTSHDPRSSGLGKVDIEIRFTATS